MSEQDQSNLLVELSPEEQEVQTGGFYGGFYPYGGFSGGLYGPGLYGRPLYGRPFYF
ncbi:hypothetical protein [Nostoc linckia]|uniref:hypothetical protein n=1 Tax=Nostoc linckia TaxID=92942 RepID=UPI0015D48B2D|nr:hypothetical protein [Nostoc linckia]